MASETLSKLKPSRILTSAAVVCAVRWDWVMMIKRVNRKSVKDGLVNQFESKSLPKKNVL